MKNLYFQFKKEFKDLKVEKVSNFSFKEIPASAGVYLFFDRFNNLIYIGKAKNLQKRIKEHFKGESFKDSLFKEDIEKVGFLETNSEIEALILEAKLIKKYQPRYNTLWKDNKNYFFLGITKEKFPRVYITHQPISENQSLKEKTIFLGPFVDGKALKKTLYFLRKIFPYRSCKNLPKKPCFWYKLNLCLGPCVFKDNSLILEKIQKELKENTNNILKIFQGKKNKIYQLLKKEINLAIKEENFEKAQEIKEKIVSLEKVLTNAKIIKEKSPLFSDSEKVIKIFKKFLEIKNKEIRIEGYDVSNIQGKETTASMVVFYNGKPQKDHYRKFKIKTISKPNDYEMLKEVLLRRFSHQEWPLPQAILIDGGKGQLSVALKLKAKDKKLKDIKFMALAKQKNELFLENEKNSILLEKLPREISNLLLQIRDEAHRFAISYHKKLREKELLKSKN
jgi:excinuclease ABC subunit C